MEDASKRRIRKRAFAYVLYPWITDPSVKFVWFSRGLYLFCVVVAAFEHKECLFISQIIGIQVFFSLVGMNGASRYSLKPRVLRFLANVTIGLFFSAVLTLALFCFKEAEILAAIITGSTMQYDYVFYLSVLIFVLLATTWLLVERRTNTVD